ncbi:uncharacterized protein B4U79_18946 [Dinothrombium tinctorium]|uniref:BTB domain-containing protein n=1 Tax=Dinothrombium tinctorium TaxID=1965070 RepID=A0A3S3SLA2_9ACAR|nr:uncharacterized protein B4U79_18946 [Dinothrombium tinctorium]
MSVLSTDGTHPKPFTLQLLEDLYLTRRLSDVKFEFDGEFISAHRSILAASSPFFLSLLYEDETRRKFTLQASSKLFEIVLRFIYTSEVQIDDLTEHETLDLLCMCQTFQLPFLADIVSKRIDTIRINFENVNKLFQTAVDLHLSSFAEKCLQYIDLNSQIVINKSEVFALFSRQLVENIVGRDTFLAEEIDIFKALKCWSELNPLQDLSAVWPKIRLNLISIEDYLKYIQPTNLISEIQFLNSFKQEKKRRSSLDVNPIKLQLLYGFIFTVNAIQIQRHGHVEQKP